MQYLTSVEFAKQAGISRIRVWVLIKAKKIKARKFDRVYRIATEELQKYKEARALRSRQQKEEEGDIGEFMGEEEPKKYWWRKKDEGSKSFFYPKSEAELKDEERQEDDVDYRHFKR